jgi:hypothetical protein
VTEWRQVAGQPFHPDFPLIKSIIERTDEMTPTPMTLTKPGAVQKTLWIRVVKSTRVPFLVPIGEELETKG